MAKISIYHSPILLSQFKWEDIKPLNMYYSTDFCVYAGDGEDLYLDSRFSNNSSSAPQLCFERNYALPGLYSGPCLLALEVNSLDTILAATASLCAFYTYTEILFILSMTGALINFNDLI
jgi:hypothetical protein